MADWEKDLDHSEPGADVWNKLTPELRKKVYGDLHLLMPDWLEVIEFS